MGYHRPQTVEEATALLAGGGLSVVAGGTDWFPARGTDTFGAGMLDITGIEGLRGITRTDGGWRFGAATTWTDVLHADVPAAFDGLKAAAREVGAVQVQNAGTLAGNLCNASPAADGVPPLLTLGAEVELAGPKGRRRLALSDFLTGVRQTARAPSELVTALYLPDPPAGAVGAFAKLGARTHLVISIAMVAAVLRHDGGRVAEARVAVGACSPVALRLAALEDALVGCPLDEVAEVVTPAHFSALSPIDDIRASAAYRAEAAVTLCRDVLAQTVEAL